MTRLAILALTLVLGMLAPAAARAADVTVCGTSNASGGRNLEQAVALGGSISIACMGTIDIVRPIQVTRPIVLDGHRWTTLRKVSSMSGPVFEVAGPQSVILAGLKIQGQRLYFLGRQASLYADIVRGPAATVTLHNVTITQSTIPLRVAKAVLADSEIRDAGVGSVVGNLYVENSQFINNYSVFHASGAAVVKSSRFEGQHGGALDVSGPGCSLRIAASTFYRNGIAGPFSAVETHCPTDITGTDFTANKGLRGAGLRIVPDGGTVRVQLFRTNFRSNAARQYGGAIALQGKGSVLLDLRNVEFNGNSAPDGGAIASERFMGQHQVRLLRTVFRGNAATGDGGAIALRASTLDATQAIFRENQAAVGGALYLARALGEPARLANSVLIGNKAGKGNAVASIGGIDFLNSTIASHSGAAIVNDVDSQDMASVVLISLRVGRPVSRRLGAQNSIFAYNGANACPGPIAGSANLQFPGNSCGSAAKVADPLLDDMLVPAFGSPARETGIMAVCLAAPVSARDVYGQPRPHARNCSIGAVEGDLDPFATLAGRLYRRVGNLFRTPRPPRQHEPDGTRLRLDAAREH